MIKITHGVYYVTKPISQSGRYTSCFVVYDYKVVIDLEPTGPNRLPAPFAILRYLSYYIRCTCYVALSSKLKCCTFHFDDEHYIY